MARTNKNRASALAYLRTSSAANVGTDKDSEKRQRHAIQGFANRAGLAIVEEFYDAQLLRHQFARASAKRREV